MTDIKTIRWGIMGPGNIAQTFIRNLLQHPPSSRGTFDIMHTITGVASSTSLTTAESFIETHINPHQPTTPCTAFGSYTSLAQSPDIDVIYIATPHSSHFRNAMLALCHNKPVLVEKPLAVNAAQAQILIDTARSRGLFLMEGMWTRFFPASSFVQDLIRTEKIGEVVRVNADFSLGIEQREGWEDIVGGREGRLLSPKLAGGVLLDLGIYAVSWVFMAVYHTIPAHLRQPPTLTGAAMTPYPPPADTSSAWVDISTTLLLTLPSSASGNTACHAIASSSLFTSTDPGYGGDDPTSRNHTYCTPSLRIIGTHGEIQLFGPLPRPQRVRVFTCTLLPSSIGPPKVAEVVKPGNVVALPDERGFYVTERVFEARGDGTGMFYEADEVGRCIRDGKMQSGVMSWDESVAVLRVLDQARERCGLAYGEVESCEWEG